MKKLLILLLLSTSFSAFAGSQLDFTLSDFCYQQPGVQDRGGVYYFPNEEVGITDSSLCVYKDLYGQYMSKVNLKNGRFDGKFIRWWENGQIHIVRNYKDGKLDGKQSDFWSDGNRYFEKNYKNDKLDGKWIEWHQNGQLNFNSNYINDKIDGEKNLWNNNGQLIAKKNYKDGKLDGKTTTWFVNGYKETLYKDGIEVNTTRYEFIDSRIFMKINYINGKQISKTVFRYHPNNSPKSEINRKYNELDGKWTEWYANGQIMSLGLWKNNKKLGKWIKWDKNGEIKSEKTWRGGNCIKGC